VEYADLLSGVRHHYRITYDLNNNVSSIVSIGGGVDTGHKGFLGFTYIGSSFRITDQDSLSYFVDAYSNGLIFKVEKYDTLLMIYEGTEIGRLDYKIPSSTYPYYTITSDAYEWHDGDLVTQTKQAGGADSFYYDLSRSGQAGDAQRIGDFLTYGRSYTPTKHLADEKKYGGTWREEYLYKFDGSGRISQFTKVINGSGSPNDTIIYGYTYY
jgi:hypothetical protein